MSHLGDKADLTPSPLLGSGSHEGRNPSQVLNTQRNFKEYVVVRGSGKQ